MLASTSRLIRCLFVCLLLLLLFCLFVYLLLFFLFCCFLLLFVLFVFCCCCFVLFFFWGGGVVHLYVCFALFQLAVQAQQSSIKRQQTGQRRQIRMISRTDELRRQMIEKTVETSGRRLTEHMNVRTKGIRNRKHAKAGDKRKQRGQQDR